MKTTIDIDLAVTNPTKNIQKAAWAATPDYKQSSPKELCPPTVKEKIFEKKRLRTKWQQNRTMYNKNKFTKAARHLKQLILDIKNHSTQRCLEELTPTEITDYSLWKATR